MNPIKLTLTNFLGIRAGLGVDEVTVDLTMDGALIALVGPNGAGKSTILDNLHPFRLMPSRSSSYSPNAFSYFDQTYGDAKKELVWTHEGLTYVSTIIIRGSLKNPTQQCYLMIVGEDGQRGPATLPDGTASDGKTKVYDALVEHIVGAPELFFTAAFAAQGRSTLDKYTAGDIKTLMGDLLGLEGLRELSARAGGEAKAYKAKVDALRDKGARAEAIGAEIHAAEDAVGNADAAVDLATDHLREARAEKDACDQRLLEARHAAANQAETRRRRETLAEQIRLNTEREAAALSTLETSRIERVDSIENGRAQANTERSRVQAAVAAAQRRLEQANATLARREAIDGATARQEAMAPELAAAREAVAEAERLATEAAAARSAEQDAAAAVKLAGQQGQSLAKACEGVRARAALTDDVPCAGTDLQGRCKLLADAMTAKADLPAKDAEVEQARDAYRTAVARKEDAEKARQALGDLPDVAAARQRLAALETEHRELAALAAQQEAVTAATLSAVEAEDEIDAADTTIAELDERIEKAQAQLAAAEADHARAVETTRATYAQERATLQRELDALPPTDDAELEVAQERAEAAALRVTACEEAVETARAALATATGAVEALRREQEALQTDIAKLRTFEDEVAHWTLLAKALGNDGVIALTIDDAGPSITAIANDLLTECYGPRFSVALVTQEETKTGTLRETFDIRVFDAERGDEKSLADTSGGQRVWINEALTRAIAIYQAQASGRRYECLFSDESDGALDAEKKRQFARVKRWALDRVGAERELFISHSAEVQECADAQIAVDQLAA